jgi:hypothetical protein
MDSSVIELMVRDTVPVAAEVLGVPVPVAELAVRHAFACPERPCIVEEYLVQRMLEAAAASSGLSIERMNELTWSISKGVADTLDLQRKEQGELRPGQAETAYLNGRDTVDTLLELVTRDQA